MAPLNDILIRQLEPPVAMLLDAIDHCPDHLWTDAGGHAPVWQHVLHAAFYLDMWLRMPDEPFVAPAFADTAAVDLTAPAEPGLDRATLRAYVESIAERCRGLLGTADPLTVVDGVAVTLADRAVGQIRHVMYHVGCISTILRQGTGDSLPWIGYETE